MPFLPSSRQMVDQDQDAQSCPVKGQIMRSTFAPVDIDILVDILMVFDQQLFVRQRRCIVRRQARADGHVGCLAGRFAAPPQQA